MSTHTPPPWLFEAGHIVSEEEVIIAAVHSADEFEPSRKGAGADEAEYHANGYVLAAAPELLAVLTKLMRWVEAHPRQATIADRVKREARIALAKAGGPPAS